MATGTQARPDSKKQGKIRSLARNRRARHEYHILDSFEAGMALAGTEVKSIRQGKIQLKDSYVEIDQGEAYLVGAHVSPYSHGNRENHDPERRRKLLLKKREIDRLTGKGQGKGWTIVPLEVYLDGNWIKVRIALAQGKKEYDKREAEKKRTQEDEMRQAMAERGRRV